MKIHYNVSICRHIVSQSQHNVTDKIYQPDGSFKKALSHVLQRVACIQPNPAAATTWEGSLELICKQYYYTFSLLILLITYQHKLSALNHSY